MDDKIELKPCPFCGGVAEQVYSRSDGEVVQCHQCFIRTDGYGDPAEAIEFWNTRVDPAVLGER